MASSATGDPAVAERLRFARQLAGYTNAQDAVDEFDLEYGTYVHHENGTRAISLDNAARYAEMFDVDLRWLATGRGQPRGGVHGPQTQSPLAGLSAEAAQQVLNLIKLLKGKASE